MADRELDDIISKVEKEKKPFLKKSALDTSSQPSEIVSRVNEVEKIVRYLLDYKQEQIVPLLSIYGRSDTEKSTLVRHGVQNCFLNPLHSIIHALCTGKTGLI